MGDVKWLTAVSKTVEVGSIPAARANIEVLPSGRFNCHTETASDTGPLAEWLSTGLLNQVPRFDSEEVLQIWL